MFKLLVILDIIILYAKLNIYELIVPRYCIHSLLEDLNFLKSKMITNDNSDVRPFLKNGTSIYFHYYQTIVNILSRVHNKQY